MQSDWDIDERRIFRNGGLKMHIGGIAQGWQSGIIQILRAHLGGMETAKKLCTDGIARFSKILGFGNRSSVLCSNDEPRRVGAVHVFRFSTMFYRFSDVDLNLRWDFAQTQYFIP